MDTYDAVLFDLFGTLVDERGIALGDAAQTLKALPRERWAVVTSCPKHLAERLIAKAGLPVPRVLVTAEDVQRGKPAPDGYLLAAQRLGATAERCLVVEDSAHGIAAGRAAGMHVVPVKSERTVAELRFTQNGDGSLVVTSDA